MKCDGVFRIYHDNIYRVTRIEFTKLKHMAQHSAQQSSTIRAVRTASREMEFESIACFGFIVLIRQNRIVASSNYRLKLVSE